MAVWHQSDLAAYSRCAAQFGYKRRGVANKTNSAAAYGSVIHHALQVFERQMALGTPRRQAQQMALETFIHYWRDRYWACRVPL